MSALETLLEAETCLILDGAMGTMLMAAGLESGSSPELWNIEHPERVRAIHRAYIAAGSRVILSNSFGGSRVRLAARGLQERAFELNLAAASLARLEADAALHTVLVAGSMGPTGEMFEPLGSLAPATAERAFAEQAAALEQGRVDLLWIETMSDLAEVQAALSGARQGAPQVPVAVTLTYDARGRTMMGVTPQRAAAALKDAEVRIIGANCGTGPDGVENVVAALREAYPEAILIAKANAGLPRMDGTELIYDGTPEVMAEYAKRARQLGATLIGACCGSTPAHIQAMSAALAGENS
jgi:methionine synthase I (cobalamin-dependent)